MRIWFDTEFYENGRTIDLISIGMVREDGQTFYAESLLAYQDASQSDWLINNVRPHLIGSSVEMYRSDMREAIIKFVGENPEFWAYYAGYDWVVLCQLFGTMMDLPRGWPMYCRDLQQEADRLGLTLPEQTSTEHHALRDAEWTQDAWNWLQAKEHQHFS